MSTEAPAAHVLFFAESAAEAGRFAAAAGLPSSPVEVHRFPDGEVRVRIPPSLPGRGIVFRSLDRPNEKLVELILVAQTAREAGVARLDLVAPYLCYMRQDVAFHPGEAVSQRIVGRFLGGLFDGLITVDPHLHRVHDLAEVVPDTRVHVLSATAPMAHFLRETVSRPLLVGPDQESRQWVEALAREGGGDFVVGTKERRGDAEVRVRLPPQDFRDRDVVLVDDVGSTGRSLVSAAEGIRPHGPRSLSALVTHGLFVGDAERALSAAGFGAVWSTDSVPGPTNRVQLAALLAAAL